MTNPTGDTPNAALIEAVKALDFEQREVGKLVYRHEVLALIEQHTQPVAVDQGADSDDLLELIYAALEAPGRGDKARLVLNVLRPYLRPTTQAAGGDAELVEAAKAILPHIRSYPSARQPKRRLEAAIQQGGSHD